MKTDKPDKAGITESLCCDGKCSEVTPCVICDMCTSVPSGKPYACITPGALARARTCFIDLMLSGVTLASGCFSTRNGYETGVCLRCSRRNLKALTGVNASAIPSPGVPLLPLLSPLPFLNFIAPAYKTPAFI